MRLWRYSMVLLAWAVQQGDGNLKPSYRRRYGVKYRQPKTKSSEPTIHIGIPLNPYISFMDRKYKQAVRSAIDEVGRKIGKYKFAQKQIWNMKDELSPESEYIFMKLLLYCCTHYP